MRTLAIGDIHGCYTALTRVVEAARISDADQLVTLGDYVDRGPDSKLVLDWLVERSRSGQLVALRGNHELMMLQARRSGSHLDYWLACGGDATLNSYTLDSRAGRLSDVKSAHWSFLEDTCRDWFETDRHFFVHANVQPDLQLADQPKYVLYWEPFVEPAAHCSGKTMVCGHTAQQSGRPNCVGHAVCIDTWAYGDGWLTCLDVASGEYWQANQDGHIRQDRLENTA